MPKNDLMGVAPQDLANNAAGVSLTPLESTFLDALLDLFLHTGDPGYPEHGDRHAPGSEEVIEYTKPAKGAPKMLLALFRKGEACGLDAMEVNYLREWVLSRGVHWLSAEKVGLGEDMKARLVFRNPVVRKIINAASEKGMCLGTCASREEIADYYTQRMRSTLLPEVVKDNAADKLARLMGYYPKETGGGGGSVNVQINCVNPYGPKMEVVKDEG